MNRVFLELDLINKKAFKDLEDFKRKAIKTEREINREAKKTSKERVASKKKEAEVAKTDIRAQLKFHKAMQAMKAKAAAVEVANARAAEKIRIGELKRRAAISKQFDKEERAAAKVLQREEVQRNKQALAAEKERTRLAKERARSAQRFFDGMRPAQTSFAAMARSAAAILLSINGARRGFTLIRESIKELNVEAAFLKEFSVGELAEARGKTFGQLTDSSIAKQLTATELFGLSRQDSVGLIQVGSALARLDPAKDANQIVESLTDATLRGSALRIDNANASLAKFVQLIADQTRGMNSAVERSRLITELLFGKDSELRKDLNRVGVLQETFTTRLQGFFLTFEQLNSGIFKMVGGLTLLTGAIGILTAKITTMLIGSAVGSAAGGIGGLFSGLMERSKPSFRNQGLIPRMFSKGGIVNLIKGVMGSLVGTIASIAALVLPLMAGSALLILGRALSISKFKGGQKFGLLDKARAFSSLGQAILDSVFGGSGNEIIITDKQFQSFVGAFGENWESLRDRLFEAATAIKAGIKAFLAPIDRLARELIGENVFGKLGTDIDRFVPVAKRIGSSIGNMVATLGKAGIEIFGNPERITSYVKLFGRAMESIMTWVIRTINFVNEKIAGITPGRKTFTRIVTPEEARERDAQRARVRSETKGLRSKLKAVAGGDAPSKAEAGFIGAEILKREILLRGRLKPLPTVIEDVPFGTEGTGERVISNNEFRLIISELAASVGAEVRSALESAGTDVGPMPESKVGEFLRQIANNTARAAGKSSGGRGGVGTVGAEGTRTGSFRIHPGLLKGFMSADPVKADQ